MLALEKERGNGAQRNTTASHVAELIIERMARPSSRSWLFWPIVAVALVALVFVLYPVRAVLEGAGTIEPEFEDLVLITTDFSGAVTRMRVTLHQDVEKGAPLFEYLPHGQWAVHARGTMSKPSGSPPEPPPAPPEWYRVGNERKAARAEAMRHWVKRLSAGRTPRPLTWESLLQQRLNARVNREDEIAMEEARAAENVRLGYGDSNLINVFDRSIGMYRATEYRATEDGTPFASAVGGTVYSLWVRQSTQFSPAYALGEIWRPETPLEVFGLVPVPPPSLRDLPGWRASLAAPGEATPTALAVSAIEFGRIPIDAGDAHYLSELTDHARERLRPLEAHPDAGSRATGRVSPDHVDVALAPPPVALARRRLARARW